MEKGYCSLFEDIYPLYLEGEVKEETKRIIDRHIGSCNRCSGLYSQEFSNAFSEIEIDMPEQPKERLFIKRVKKTFLFIVLGVITVFLTTNAIAYVTGKKIGIYGERFRVAEQNKLFVEVNEEVRFGDEKIMLEKMLLDSTVTTLIFKTSVNLDSMDSVTLKDDKNNFYRKNYTLFNAVPLKFEKRNGYTILNFESVSRDSKKLTLEIIDWRKNEVDNAIEKSATFNIDINQNKLLDNIFEKKDVLKRKTKDYVFSIDSLVKSSSQTELIYTFDYSESKYDGITLGWNYDEYIDNKERIKLFNTNINEEIKVSSSENITYKKLMENKEKTDITVYKVLFNPIGENVDELELSYEDLYGFFNLKNQELEIDLKEGQKIEINKVISLPDRILKIIGAQMKDGSIKLQYKVESDNGENIKTNLLDARIRLQSNKYDVPKEGFFIEGKDFNEIAFDVENQGKYIIELSRLGEKISFEVAKINIK